MLELYSKHFLMLLILFLQEKFHQMHFLPLQKSFPIYFIIIAACVGVTVAGTSLIANSIGEKNKKNILIYFGQTIIYGIILSIIITFIGLYYAADIFAMMGSTTEVISLGLQYTNVIFSGSVVFISVVALNSLLHAEGDTKTFRNVLILSFILNIFLNPLFIFGYGFIPAMGMTGHRCSNNYFSNYCFFNFVDKNY